MRELGFDDQRDTLGRWMAHHVAELMQQSKTASTAAQRAKARRAASETILKIWQHRTSLSGNAYPLARYDEILKVLKLLRPEDNPFKHFGHHANAKREELAATLFDRLSRLIMALLFMSLRFDGSPKKANAAAFKALSTTEKKLLTELRRWSELFAPMAKQSKSTRNGKKEDGTKVSLNEVAVQLIDSISNTLVGLRKELQKSAEPVS